MTINTNNDGSITIEYANYDQVDDLCKSFEYIEDMPINDTTQESIVKLIQSGNDSIVQLIIDAVSHIYNYAPARNATRYNAMVIDIHMASFDNVYDFMGEARRLDIKYEFENDEFPIADKYFMIVVEIYSTTEGHLYWIETYITKYGFDCTTDVYYNFQYEM